MRAWLVSLAGNTNFCISKRKHMISCSASKTGPSFIPVKGNTIHPKNQETSPITPFLSPSLPFAYTHPICHLDPQAHSPKQVKGWIIYIHLSGHSSIQTTIIFSLDYDKLAGWVSLLPFLPSHDPLSTEQPEQYFKTKLRSSHSPV